MTSASRAARRRAARGRPDGDTEYRVQVGWAASELELPGVRKVTHDGVIEDLGDRRTSGVSWLQYEGDAAMQRIEEFMALSDNTLELQDAYRRIRGLLREHGGIFVVAMAPGIRP